MNDRARDVVDLIRLSNLAIAIGHPSLVAIRRAADGELVHYIDFPRPVVATRAVVDL